MNLTRSTLIAGAILGVLFVVTVIFHYTTFTSQFPGHNDFLTVWEGSRAYFYDGLDPYSEEVSTNIQMRIYGRPAEVGEFPNHYAYPFYATFFVWPTIHFDYAWATAIWMVTLEACLIGGVMLSLSLFNWRPKPLMLAGLLLFALVWYPGARGLFLGQVSHLTLLLQIAALWGVMKGRDRLGGVALAAATFKPQMVLLFVPFLLLWGLVNRRWQFLTAFGLAFGALNIVSFLLLPDWVEGMLYQIGLYPTYIEVSTPAWVVTQYMLNLGDGAEWAVNLFFYALMLWTWYTVLVERREERFLWAVMVTITVTHLVAFRTATPHFSVFVLPLVFYLQRFARQRRGGLIVVTLLVLFIVPWVHFFPTLGAEKFEHPTLFVPIPAAFMAILWFTRGAWWRDAPRPKGENAESAAVASSIEGNQPA